MSDSTKYSDTSSSIKYSDNSALTNNTIALSIVIIVVVEVIPSPTNKV